MRMRDIAALGRQRHGSVRVESSGLLCKTKGQGQTQRKGSPAAGIAVQGAQGETGAMNNFKGIEERGGRKQRIWHRIAVLRGRRRLASYAGEMAQQHTARCCCCAAAAAGCCGCSGGRISWPIGALGGHAKCRTAAWVLVPYLSGVF